MDTKGSSSGWINSYYRESRKETEPLEPIEPKDIGKQSTRPFFGQVFELKEQLHLEFNYRVTHNGCDLIDNYEEFIHFFSLTLMGSLGSLGNGSIIKEIYKLVSSISKTNCGIYI